MTFNVNFNRQQINLDEKTKLNDFSNKENFN